MRIAQLARFASENRMRSCAGCHSSRILEPASTSKKSPSCGLCRGTYRGASTPIAGFGRILAGPHVGCWASAHDMSRLANRGKVSAAAPRPTKPRVRRTRGSECGGAGRGGRSRFQGKRDVPAVKCAGRRMDAFVGSVRAVCHGIGVRCRLTSSRRFRRLRFSSSWTRREGRRRCRPEPAACGKRGLPATLPPSARR
jgi:hypothetical protein